MTDTPNPLPPAASGLFQRAKDILLKPKETWPVIAAEPATVQSIYVPYVLLLAAIGPLAQLVGGQVFGITFLGVTYHPPLAGALVSAVLSYGLTLASVFLLALVIDGLFGIGLSRPVAAPYDGWIEWANAQDAPILALDVPSGAGHHVLMTRRAGTE